MRWHRLRHSCSLFWLGVPQHGIVLRVHTGGRILFGFALFDLVLLLLIELHLSLTDLPDIYLLFRTNCVFLSRVGLFANERFYT